MDDDTTNESRWLREMAALAREKLEPGERIAWLAQPLPGRFARRGLVNAIIGIPCTVFGLLFIAVTTRFHMPHFKHPQGFFLPLGGLVFVLIGIGLLLTPWWKRRKALRMAYVITDRRALILDASNRPARERSYARDTLKILCSTQNADGSGDIVLEREVRFDGETNETVDHGFLAVGNVKDVEAMLGKPAQG